MVERDVQGVKISGDEEDVLAVLHCLNIGLMCTQSMAVSDHEFDELESLKLSVDEALLGLGRCKPCETSLLIM